MPQDLLDLIPNRERSHSAQEKRKKKLRILRDIKGCENLIKHQEENEKELRNTIKLKQSDLNNLKEQLQTNPGYHTLEYIENKMENKLLTWRLKSKNMLHHMLQLSIPVRNRRINNKLSTSKMQ